MSSDHRIVTVVGGASVDIFGRPASPLVEFDSNPGSVAIAPGGVARNAAENLARLGIEVQLITAIGDDANGRSILRACEEAGIGTAGFLQCDALPTATYLAILDELGDMRIAISDMDVISRLGVAHLESCRELLEQSSLLVLDTNLGEESLSWLTREFGDRPIFLDTVSTAKAPRSEAFLPACHTIKTSKIEAECLAGIKASDAGGLEAIARWFRDRGVDRLFVTLGQDGVFYSTADAQGEYRLELGSRDVANSGGAGDAFLAALVVAWFENYSVERTLRFALAAADMTLACTATNNPDLSRETIAARLEQARD